MAEEVERRPLGAEDRACVTTEQRGVVVGPNVIAVTGLAVDLHVGAVLRRRELEHGNGRLEAREHAVLLDDELGLARRTLGDRRARREIAARRVFSQGDPGELFVYVCHRLPSSIVTRGPDVPGRSLPHASRATAP